MPAAISRSGDDDSIASTRLGDWYANRVNIGRHRLLLCTSETSLLSLVVPAKDLRHLPTRLITALADLLRRLGVSESIIMRELHEMQRVRLGRTASRRVLGHMNDFVEHIHAHFAHSERIVYLSELEDRLADTLCGPKDYKRPADIALQLLGSAH